MYVRKEAVLSSQIEGTQSSLQDVLAAEAKILAPDLRYRQEYYDLLQAVRDQGLWEEWLHFFFTGHC